MKREVAVAAVLGNDLNEVLLVHRRHAPEEGRWAVPGGRVEPGERFDAALRREVAEETRLEIEVGPLLYVSEVIDSGTRYVILDFGVWLAPSTPPLAASSDAAAARFFGRDAWRGALLAKGMTGLLEDRWVREFLQWD